MDYNQHFSDAIEIVYDSFHWEILRRFREQAITIMKTLSSREIVSAIHGSVARGDVDEDSDIDIIISHTVSSNTIELALTLNGFEIYSRKIAQATPSHTPKAHIFLDANEKICVTFPLIPFLATEYEFYKFGGLLELEDLERNDRVPGCDKRLMLIEPTVKGHVESRIQGREAEIARKVRVSVDIINERIRVLKRREKIGRTGIVFSIGLRDGEVFEEVLKRVSVSNPIVRRRLLKK